MLRLGRLIAQKFPKSAKLSANVHINSLSDGSDRNKLAVAALQAAIAANEVWEAQHLLGQTLAEMGRYNEVSNLYFVVTKSLFYA